VVARGVPRGDPYAGRWQRIFALLLLWFYSSGGTVIVKRKTDIGGLLAVFYWVAARDSQGGRR